EIYVSNKLNNISGDIKKEYTFIRNFLNFPEKKSIDLDCVFEKSTREVADDFNDYFVNIGVNIANNFNDVAECTQFNNAANESFTFTPVSAIGVIKVIDSFKNNKSSSGIITNKILKLNKTSLCHPIAVLFNKCITQSIFPSIKKKRLLYLYSRMDAGKN